MTEPHTLKSFDVALDDLMNGLNAMGGRVCSMVNRAGQAAIDFDTDLASEIIRDDLAVDRDFEALRARCLETLTRFHPVARDLRQVMAVEHAAGNVERIGDHAKSIAKRVISMSEDPSASESVTPLFATLHKAALEACEDALDAFARRDSHFADQIIKNDRRVDTLHDDLFHEVIASVRAGKKALPGIQLLFVAKSMERIGDHATNIAEEAAFMARGDQPSATRSTDDKA